VVAGTLTCGAEGSAKVTVKTEGRFTATSFDTNSRSEIGAGGAKMTTEARVVGKRLGECDITEDFKGTSRVGG
jgi:K+/H+ antiporter YhaU regulatory subunit KhtT